MCGKRFALCLVLSLLLLSPTLSAEVCLTDDEFQELTTIFTTLENTLATQSLELQTLQTQLATAETRLADSQNSIETLKLTYNELKASWQEQRREAIKTAVIASLISAIAGFVVGLWL